MIRAYLRLIMLSILVITTQHVCAAQLNRSYATAAKLKAVFLSDQQGHKATAEVTAAIEKQKGAFLTFIESHKAPANLQAPLDAIFKQKPVQTVLEKINGVLNPIMLDQKMSALQKELASCGFTCVDKGYPHVLSHSTLPAWILKLPTPWFEYSVLDTWAAEMRNGGRVAYALKLDEYCKSKKYPVTVPTKYVYSVPKVNGMDLPLTCVVAQRLDLSKALPALTKKQELIMTDLYQNRGFVDDNAG